MRGLSLCRLPLTFALAAACGGGELTLPGAGDPATLVIVAGDGQLGPKGQLLADPLVVEVRDGIGRPVAGADVAFRFTVEVPDASVDPGAAPTDGLGRASAHAQLGNRSGAQPIEATVAVPGEDLRVRFQLTALPDDPPPDGTGGGGGGAGPGGGDDPGSSPPPAPEPPPVGGGGGGGDHGKGHDKDHDGGHGKGHDKGHDRGQDHHGKGHGGDD